MNIYGTDLNNEDHNNFDIENVNFLKRWMYKLYKIYINIDEYHCKFQDHSKASLGILQMAIGKYI